MIDTHCHLYDKKLYHKLDEIVDNAENSNIKKSIIINEYVEIAKSFLNKPEVSLSNLWTRL